MFLHFANRINKTLQNAGFILIGLRIEKYNLQSMLRVIYVLQENEMAYDQGIIIDGYRQAAFH